MAINKDISIVVSVDVLNTNNKVSNFWDDIKTFLMSTAETELGLTPGSGEIQEGTVVSLVRGETNTTITANFSFEGQWEPS